MASIAQRSAARSAPASPRWRLPIPPVLAVAVSAMGEPAAGLIRLPEPAGLARPDPALTRQAAEAVAEGFEMALRHRAGRAAP